MDKNNCISFGINIRVLALRYVQENNLPLSSFDGYSGDPA
jgi:hypothetical protein